MSVLDRLFGRRERSADGHRARGDETRSTQAQAAHHGTAVCPHVALTPRWDRIEDMGHEDRATSFVCDACHRTLTPGEAVQARAASADRIRVE